MNAIIIILAWVGLSCFFTDRSLGRDIGWTIHNGILHPVSDIVYWLGLRTEAAKKASDWVHGLVAPDESDYGKGPDRTPRT
jgi:hypothetical protein